MGVLSIFKLNSTFFKWEIANFSARTVGARRASATYLTRKCDEKNFVREDAPSSFSRLFYVKREVSKRQDAILRLAPSAPAGPLQLTRMEMSAYV